MANTLGLPTVPTPNGPMPVAKNALSPSAQLNYDFSQDAPALADASALVPPQPPQDPFLPAHKAATHPDPFLGQPAASAAAVPSGGVTPPSNAAPPAAPPPEAAAQPPIPGANLGSSLAELNTLQRAEHVDQATANRDIDRVAHEKIKAVEAQGQVDQAKNAETYKILNDNQTAQQKLDQRALETQAAIKTHTDAQMSVVQGLTQQQAARTFDPERYDKSLGFAGRMMNSIGIALGAFSQSYTGSGTNPGMVMYMKHRDDDIAAQKQQFEQGEKNLSNANNIYSQLRQKGLDDAQATAAAKAVANEQAKNQIAILGAKLGGPDAAAKKQALLASIDGDSAKAHQEVQQGSHTQALAQINAKTAAREFELKQQEAQAALAQKGAKLTPIQGEALTKIDSNVTGLKALLENASAFDEATKGGDSYLPGINVLGQLSGTSATRKALNLRKDNAGFTAATFEPTAKSNQFFVEKAEDQTPDPRYMGHQGGLARYKTQFKAARDSLETHIKDEAGAGHDVSAIQKQLDELDQKAADLGIFDGKGLVHRKPVEGGR